MNQKKIGPCDWDQFQKEMGGVLGQDPQEFFHFCQDIHHLGQAIWNHVITIFKKAGELGKHREALSHLKRFYTENELWREFAQLPEKLREGLQTLLSEAAFPIH